MTDLSKQLDMEMLEGMVDRYSLSDVFGMLSDICNEKAEHVETNWQDKPLAKAWEQNAETLARIILKPT